MMALSWWLMYSLCVLWYFWELSSISITRHHYHFHYLPLGLEMLTVQKQRSLNGAERSAPLPRCSLASPPQDHAHWWSGDGAESFIHSFIIRHTMDDTLERYEDDVFSVVYPASTWWKITNQKSFTWPSSESRKMCGNIMEGDDAKSIRPQKPFDVS